MLGISRLERLPPFRNRPRPQDGQVGRVLRTAPQSDRRPKIAAITTKLTPRPLTVEQPPLRRNALHNQPAIHIICQTRTHIILISVIRVHSCSSVVDLLWTLDLGLWTLD